MYRLLDNSYYSSLADKIINKHKISPAAMTLLCDNEEYPKKEMLSSTIADLSMQYNRMMNEIVSLLDKTTPEFAENRANRLIEEISEKIVKETEIELKLNRIQSPAGLCNLILIKNTITLYCNDEFKFMLEYSSPEKALDANLMIMVKLQSSY